MPERTITMLLSNGLASDPRVEKEAAALAEAGWNVHAVAWDRSGAQARLEHRGHLEIERVGPVAAYGSGLKTLPLFREFWRNAADAAATRGSHVVHCHDMDTAQAGLAALSKMAPDTRLVLDLHEMYRESRMVPSRPGLRQAARAAIDLVERRTLARADLLVLAAPAMEERYVGFEPRVTVENAPDAQRFRPEGTAPSGDQLVVCYAGAKRYAASLIMLMGAVQTDPRLHARLAGSGVAAEEVAAAAQGLDRVEVSGAFTYEEAPGLYRGCDAVYAVYDASVGNIRVALPVKALEGMASGLPVIANTGTWFGDLVEGEGFGFTVGGDDLGELAHVLRVLADDPLMRSEMGQRGRRYVEEYMNWTAASHRLVEAYELLG